MIDRYSAGSVGLVEKVDEFLEVNFIIRFYACDFDHCLSELLLQKLTIYLVVCDFIT